MLFPISRSICDLVCQLELYLSGCQMTALGRAGAHAETVIVTTCSCHDSSVAPPSPAKFGANGHVEIKKPPVGLPGGF